MLLLHWHWPCLQEFADMYDTIRAQGKWDDWDLMVVTTLNDDIRDLLSDNYSEVQSSLGASVVSPPICTSSKHAYLKTVRMDDSTLFCLFHSLSISSALVNT